eukprot:Amastigsp_a4823_88.p3 type:complete len:140 gc:universal Amastigsp_a4823_88:423-4(-)
MCAAPGDACGRVPARPLVADRGLDSVHQRADPDGAHRRRKGLATLHPQRARDLGDLYGANGGLAAHCARVADHRMERSHRVAAQRPAAVLRAACGVAGHDGAQRVVVRQDCFDGLVQALLARGLGQQAQRVKSVPCTLR